VICWQTFKWLREEELGVHFAKTLLMLVTSVDASGKHLATELFVVVCASEPQLSVTFVYGNHKDRSLQMKPSHN
jgi:hypothetical protein